MKPRIRKTFSNDLIAVVSGLLAFAATALSQAGTLSFSQPQLLALLLWTSSLSPGVPLEGADRLVVDSKGRFLLVSNLDFDLFSPEGKWIRTTQPIDPHKNFYGFAAFEALPKGEVGLLVRLESPQEQWGKDNFEMRSRPGVRRVTLDAQGQILDQSEWADPAQPHSSYWLLDNALYAVHDDGTYQSRSKGSSKVPEALKTFALIASSPEHWLAHLRSLSVFHSKDRAYHDVQGKTHAIKDADSFLFGRRYVEGIGPLTLRRGLVYYQVLCDTKDGFRNAVFVEDPVRKRFGLVELVPATVDLEGAKKPALFVDPKGNLYEGVSAKDGYRIYEWKRLN